MGRRKKKTSPRRQSKPAKDNAEENENITRLLKTRRATSESTVMKTKSSSVLSNSFLILLLFLLSAAAAAASVPQIAMAAEQPEQAAPATAQEATVQIVYVDRPADADPEEFHIRTLAPVLGRSLDFRGSIEIEIGFSGRCGLRGDLLICGLADCSEEKAKEAVLYHYKHAASGFSAKLTPQQVEELKKQPGVLQVVPSQTYQLHGPGAGTGTMNTVGLL